MTTGSRRAWWAALAGIPAWLVHLVAEASLAGEACASPQTIWVMHAVTAACAAVTLVAMAVAWPFAWQAADHEGADPPARLRFVGRFGLLLGAINLLLILGEGSYVVLVRRC
jgi:hypothetical protein